jgi:hypothetical protein
MPTNLVKVTMKLDTAQLRRSFEALARNTRQVPSKIVNSACYNVAYKAMENMPVVTPARMDQELGATSTPAILKSGALSKNKNRQMENVSLQPWSYAAMIVIASMHPDSHFNQLTGKVWQRQMLLPRAAGASGMYGTARNDFITRINEIAIRMVKARHKSSAFFKACAGTIVAMFKPSISGDSTVRALAMTGMDALPGGIGAEKSIGRLAGGTVAVDTGGGARARFWVSATEPETEGTVQPKAIFSIAQPVWQRAIAEVATGNMRHVAQKLYEEGVKKTRGWRYVRR